MFSHGWSFAFPATGLVSMKCVVNLFDQKNLSYESEQYGDSYAGSSAPIAKLWNSKKLGFHAEIVDPGTFSCPYHLHHEDEELFLVLEGSAICRQDGEFFELKAGDLILFKTGVAHQFYNHTDKPFRFLALSSKSPDEVCEYPDSRKRLEYPAMRITQEGAEVSDYWKDETNPRQHWPPELLKPVNR